MPCTDEVDINSAAVRVKAIFKIYRKIPRNKPRGLYFQRPFWRGLSTDGNLRFKIDWASRIVGSKFTIFALLYFVFEGNFATTSPQGGLYLEGRFNGGFLRYRIGGLYFEGVMTHGGADDEVDICKPRP